MANTQVLQRDFSGGFAQDYPRDQMPPGKVWYCENVLPTSDGSSISRRGGWAYATSTVSGLTFLASACWAPNFNSGSGEIIVTADFSGTKKFVSYNPSTGTGTDRGNVGGSTVNALGLVHYNDAVYCTNGLGGGMTTRKINSSYTVSSITVPVIGGAAMACVHQQRLVVIGNNYATFSDPQTDTFGSLSYLGIPRNQITAVASVNDMLLLWTDIDAFRIRGNTPPPARGMIVEGFSNQGVSWPQGVTVNGDRCYFVNKEGVFVTDGASVSDVTASCGVSQWWRDNVLTTQIQSVGAFREFVFAPTALGVLVLNTLTRAAWVIADYFPFIWAKREDVPDELYFSPATSQGANTTRLSAASTFWTPSSTYKDDGDGTDHVALIETPYYGLGHPSQKRLRRAYITYDLRDAASDNPTLTPSYITSPESTSYTSMTALSEATALTRARRDINKKAHGVAFKLTSANAASDMKLYSLELESHPLEHSRVG